MFALHRVPPDLAPYVACFWTLESPASGEPQAPIAPDGCCEWIIHLADAPLVARHGGWQRQPREFLFGQLHAPLVLTSDRPMRCLAVRFHPYAVAPLLRVSGAALASEELVFAKLGRHLAHLASLTEQQSLAATLPHVVHELRRLARAARPLDPLVERACATLGSPDDVRIAALARRLATSTRTLERRFVDAVGLTPKRYARIARMQRSLAALAVPGARAVHVAHALGYSDQARFTRELAALAGVRPGEVAAAA